MAVGAVVWIERVVEAAAPFGVTLDGLKVHVDSGGRPEQAKVTVGLKLAGGAGVIVRLSWVICPRVTVRLIWAGAIVKSTTVKATAAEEELAKFGSPP
jgi:hypothetical protein